MANKKVDQLIQVLGEMIEIFEKLLRVADEKQKQMILLDMNSLERTTEEEGKLLDEMIVLQESSSSILHEINKVFFNTNSLVLGKLVQLSNNSNMERADDLNNIYTRLLNVSAKLKDLNEKNQKLAKFSLEIIRDTVRFICKESTGGTTYRKSGRFNTSESLLSLIDTQA